MANFYTDIPELKYHLNNPMMQRICELKERGYEDKDRRKRNDCTRNHRPRCNVRCSRFL